MLAAKAYFVNLQLVLHAMRIFAIVYKHYVVIIISPGILSLSLFLRIATPVIYYANARREREEGIVLIFQILLSVHEEC